MQLVLKTLFGKTIMVEVESSDTIGTIADKVRERTGKNENVDIMFGGKELLEDLKFSESGLRESAPAQVKFSPMVITKSANKV